jgi:hypothetical protein
VLRQQQAAGPPGLAALGDFVAAQAFGVGDAARAQALAQ